MKAKLVEVRTGQNNKHLYVFEMIEATSYDWPEIGTTYDLSFTFNEVEIDPGERSESSV